METQEFRVLNRMCCKERKRRKRSLLNRMNGYIHCAYCLLGSNPEDLTLDHVIPLSKGGTNNLTNLVLACFRCNNEKANYSVDEWFARGQWFRVGIRNAALLKNI